MSTPSLPPKQFKSALHSRHGHRISVPALLVAGFALCPAFVPLAHAELSNESLIGPAVRVRPAYDGSDSHRTELVPVIRYFGQTLFARSTQGVLEGGARMELAPGLHIGAQLAYEPGRKTSESGYLGFRNMPDIDTGASVGAHVEWDHKFGRMPVTLLLRARQHTESARGAQADLRLSAGVFQSGSFSAGVFTQATWANGKSTDSFYGVSPRQAAAGFPAYSAGGGLLSMSVGLLWAYDISSQWLVVGSLEARRLHGDAARSPVVEHSSSNYASAGLAYRF